MTNSNQAIAVGMTVHSADGEKLGRVMAITETEIHVEKGIFFPKDYVVLLQDIREVRGDDVILTKGREALRPEHEQGAPTPPPPSNRVTMPAAVSTAAVEAEIPTAAAMPTSAPTAPTMEARPARAGSEAEMSVPIAQEELDVSKRDQQVGAVHLRKDVVEETKTIEVPVRKEQVHIERVDRTDQDLPVGATAFEEGEVVIPVHEEEVEVSKRTVVTGEVRVRREAYEEEQRVAQTVRREEVRVDTEGEVNEVRGAPGRGNDEGKY